MPYSPADATATQSLASVKYRLVLPFWYWLTQVVPDKGPLNGCVYAPYNYELTLITWQMLTFEQSFSLFLEHVFQRSYTLYNGNK